MVIKFFNKYLMLLVIIAPCGAQLIPEYPIEISFSPVGYGNQIPGNKPKTFSTFSSLKIFLFKELVAKSKISHSINFEGALDYYHDITKARDYNPLYTQAGTRTFLFVSDIFSLGLEFLGNIITKPGTDKDNNTFNQVNYRGRVRPFHYLILTPNLILKEIFTIGTSRHADSSMIEVDLNKFSLLKSDYDIYKYEAHLIYFTTFSTRIFASPYVFYNQYLQLPARSKDGSPNPGNPKLREQGLGITIGGQYTTPNWGITEFVFEYERNTDMIFDANSYIKIKAYVKSEFLYVTDYIGYSSMLSWTSYISKNFSTGFTQESNLTGELGQKELFVDLILIYNINKNLSIRPEYEGIYRFFPSSPDFKRSNLRMQFHVRF